MIGRADIRATDWQAVGVVGEPWQVHAVLAFLPCFVKRYFNVTLISGFRRDVDEICGLLGNYTASCGNYLPTFRDNVSIPSSRVNIPSGNV
jgi:hypothetical protein